MFGPSRPLKIGIYILVVSLCFQSALASKSTLHWTAYARHVGQTEKSREAALQELRKIKNLDQALLKALRTSKKPLALDVISALRMMELVPKLLSRIQSDDDGFIVLTLNSLLTEENKSEVLEAYLKILKTSQKVSLSPATLVAMLEPMGRLGAELTFESVSNLMRHESYEVRSATLYYVREMTLMKGKMSYLSHIADAIGTSPYQIRMQALYLIDELLKKPGVPPPISETQLSSKCKEEKRDTVRKHCFKVLQVLKGKS